MATYLVTYDLNEEVKRPPIVDVVRAFEAWAKLSESSYAISTALSVSDVYAKFSPLLDDNDQLYVITLIRPYTGQGDKEINEWLEAGL